MLPVRGAPLGQGSSRRTRTAVVRRACGVRCGWGRTDVDGAKCAGPQDAAERDVTDAGAGPGGDVSDAQPAARAAAAAVLQRHREHGRLERLAAAAVQEQPRAALRLPRQALGGVRAARLDAACLHAPSASSHVPFRAEDESSMCRAFF